MICSIYDIFSCLNMIYFGFFLIVFSFLFLTFNFWLIRIGLLILFQYGFHGASQYHALIADFAG